MAKKTFVIEYTNLANTEFEERIVALIKQPLYVEIHLYRYQWYTYIMQKKYGCWGRDQMEVKWREKKIKEKGEGKKENWLKIVSFLGYKLF